VSSSESAAQVPGEKKGEKSLLHKGNGKRGKKGKKRNAVVERATPPLLQLVKREGKKSFRRALGRGIGKEKPSPSNNGMEGIPPIEPPSLLELDEFRKKVPHPSLPSLKREMRDPFKPRKKKKGAFIRAVKGRLPSYRSAKTDKKQKWGGRKKKRYIIL